MTDRIINAKPTKSFFIEMLTKDITLTSVICDLVDNCVDGARRGWSTDSSENTYEGLSIRIALNSEHFKIADNCGGIDVGVARDYAFRFGRPPDMPATTYSIGQFGVGMKRAIFKLGRRFRVESRTANSRFVIEEDIEEWAKNDQWVFEFRELDEDVMALADGEEPGTTIEVSSLHSSVAADFGLENFIERLGRDIESRHRQSMDRGLAITLNELPLHTRTIELLYSDDLQPAFSQLSLEDGKVSVKIWAGLSDSKPRECGWYVFCNGRLILEADKDSATGWGDPLPRYHHQYNRFRGYVFFDSDDAMLLPWNTTKDSVDVDLPLYRAVRERMNTLARPVIDFLNRVKEEKSLVDVPDDAPETRQIGPLSGAITDARARKISGIEAHEQSFRTPSVVPQQSKLDTVRISYLKPRGEYNRVRERLEASTQKEVGERTFEYFLTMECDD